MDEINAIASGILQAVQRGESLDKAMNTFINAGYSREVVSQAARKAQEALKNKKPISVSSTKKAPTRTKPHLLSKVRPRMQPPPRMEQESDRDIQPLEPEEIGGNVPQKSADGKKKKKIITWIIAITIIIITVLVNVFLIWKYGSN